MSTQAKPEIATISCSGMTLDDSCTLSLKVVENMPNGGQQEVVMLFNNEGSVMAEMYFSTFERLLNGDNTLEGHAASVVKAAYCVVGNGLAVRGAVFFLFSVNEEGYIDPSFNLPLRYLVQQAGVAEDLGQGGVRKASRGQCPVPWHAVNLWEPETEKGLSQVQSRIYRNKLKLKNSTGCRDEDFFPPQALTIELSASDSRQDLDYQLQGNGFANLSSSDERQAQDKTQLFAAKLTEVFGDAGKLSLQDLIRLHTEQLEQAKLQYRDQLEAQQMSYLDQLRCAREEIHELKVTLRQEQGRSRRLQQMLRGDI
jgi:hypothetical protein